MLSSVQISDRPLARLTFTFSHFFQVGYRTQPTFQPFGPISTPRRAFLRRANTEHVCGGVNLIHGFFHAVNPIHTSRAANSVFLAYLTAHLKADPKATAIVSDAEAESATLQTQIQDWDSKRHAIQETQTGPGNVTATLRNAVRHAHNEILDELEHDRRAPKFLTYFPRGVMAFTKASCLDLVTDFRSLIQRCAQDTSPRIQEQATALQVAVDQMDAAFARRAEANANEGAAYGQLQVQKLQSIEVCRRAGNRLAELYPNRQDRVRSHFRRVVRRPRATPPTEGETAPATGTAATATAADATPGGTTLAVTPAGTALASGTPASRE
jgi:hypothetical protein